MLVLIYTINLNLNNSVISTIFGEFYMHISLQLFKIIKYEYVTKLSTICIINNYKTQIIFKKFLNNLKIYSSNLKCILLTNLK